MSFVPVRKTGAFSDVWPPEGYTLFWFSARYGRVINMSPPLQTDFRASRAWQMVFPLVGAFAQPMGIILLYFAKKGTSLDIIGYHWFRAESTTDQVQRFYSLQYLQVWHDHGVVLS
jgi:hypothetical protein